MLINGEKWACDSCIKGHRVSGCQHHDRKLTHINPKGRPVKQCEHCRGARKSKAHHARCECGEKKDHKGGAIHGCSCHHGKQCICGTKKANDLKVDTARASKKPRLTATHSDPAITIFANGHHKPCHRLNNTAHSSGAPYMIPKAHSLHSHSKNSSLASMTQLYGVTHAEDIPYMAAGEHDRYVELGVDPRSHFTSNSTESFEYHQGLVYSPQFDRVSSQSGSPTETMSGSSGQVPLQHWPMHNYTPPSTGTFPIEEMTMSPNVDYAATPDHEWSIPSAGLEHWSAVDLPLDPNKLNNQLTKATSHSGESNPTSVPGLTSSPGIPSETGESGPFGEIDGLHINMGGEQSMFDKAHKYSDRSLNRLNGVAHDLSRPPTSEPDNNNNNRNSWSLEGFHKTRSAPGMSYYIEGQQSQKDVPRTEPMTFASTSSPDLTSLQALAIQSDYHSLSPEAKPTIYTSHDDQHSPVFRRFEIHPIGVPLDQLESSQSLHQFPPEWPKYTAHA